MMEYYKKVLITPPRAEQMLESSKGNRSESNKRICKYAEMMKAGKWNYSNDAIVVDEDGSLRNGHHRLHAIIKAGVAIEMWVCYNAPRNAWFTFDNGKARDLSDMLEIEEGDKIKNSRTFAAVARFLYAYEKNKHQLSSTIDLVLNEDVFHYAQSHKDEINDCMKIISHRKGLKCNSVFAVFRILAIRKGYFKEYIDSFLDKVFTGANLEIGNPILAFRNRCLSIQTNHGSNKERISLFFLLIKVFNLYKKGMKISKLYMPNDIVDIENP